MGRTLHVVLAVLLFDQSPVHAKPDVVDPAREGRRGQTELTSSSGIDDSQNASPEAVDDPQDPVIREALVNLALARMKSEHRREETIRRDLDVHDSVVRWTNRIGYGIGIFVHAMVLFGLWASAREFRAASRHAASARKSGGQPTDREAAKTQDSKIEISADRVVLQTSLHGVVLLAISMGFYALYILKVYPLVKL